MLDQTTDSLTTQLHMIYIFNKELYRFNDLNGKSTKCTTKMFREMVSIIASSKCYRYECSPTASDFI